MILDGNVIGLVQENQAEEFTNIIRKIIKLETHKSFDKLKNISISFIPKKTKGVTTQIMPGIYLYSTEGRLTRQVFNIKGNQVETIDPFE